MLDWKVKPSTRQYIYQTTSSNPPNETTSSHHIHLKEIFIIIAIITISTIKIMTIMSTDQLTSQQASQTSEKPAVVTTMNPSENGLPNADGPAIVPEGMQHGTGVDSHRSDASELLLREGVIENPRKIKVIVVGAGYSGIYHGIRIPERIKNCELTIFEKNDAVGGTW